MTPNDQAPVRCADCGRPVALGHVRCWDCAEDAIFFRAVEAERVRQPGPRQVDEAPAP